MFSSKSFIVSGLTFRSLIHFEFIFVYGVRKCSNFILLHGAVQLSPEKAMAPHSSTLDWKIPWTEEPCRVQSTESRRVWNLLSNFTFHFHAWEKEMATHPSVLAWRISGMAEPGGLLSIGLHRVGHDWSDLAAAAEIQFSQHHLLKRLSLPHCIFLLPLSKNKMSLGAGVCFWAFYLGPLVYISVYVPVPYCIDDCGFVV